MLDSVNRHLGLVKQRDRVSYLISVTYIRLILDVTLQDNATFVK